MTYGQFFYVVIVSVLLSAAVTLGITDFMINKQLKEGVNTGPVTFMVQDAVSPEIRRKAEENKALSEAKLAAAKINIDNEFSRYAGFTVEGTFYVTNTMEVKEMIEESRNYCGDRDVKLLKFYETTFPLIICEKGNTK
ncbi:hypothetical protein PJM41_0030 [Salmonella phage vB_SenS_UTK0009]|uniref:Uncharacterized protein n=1 Tax=Salmonella phage vB_SenS_UTK0009 TaxID=3028908 RepID=A0AAF0CIB0_9CAUD|nr:hypothetical protein PJM41_0030 [Salmonella phage vB_SenS_UTK0009]